MKTKNKTRYLQSILGAILAVSAALVLSCEQPDGSSVGAPAGKGSVAISVSTGGPAGSVLKTIVPDTDSPKWSKYDLVFKSEGKPDVEVSDLTALEDFEQALDVGTWTVYVTVYQNFTPTPTGEEDAVAYDYQAATGTSESFTVTAGELETVDVSVKPIPQTTEGLTGIFSYAVEYTGEDDVTGELTLGEETLTLALDGKTVSKAVSPGNYKLTVKLTKGELAVTRSAEVHIYAGFESKAAYTFTDANFTKYVYLVGDKPNLPTNVSLTAIGVYTDAGYSSDNIIEGTGYDSTETEWFVWIPVAEIENTLYLKSVMTTGSGESPPTYTATAKVEGLTETGKDGVKLDVVTSGSFAATNLTSVIAALAEDGKVELGSLTITGTGPVTLPGVDVAVTGNITIPNNVEFVVGDSEGKGTLTVAEGGELKVTGSITVNNGADVTVADSAKLEVTTGGGITISENAALNVTGELDMTAGALTVAGDLAVDGAGTLKVAADATVSVAGGLTVAGKLDVADNAKVTVAENGVFFLDGSNLGGEVTDNGTLAGTITIASGAKTYSTGTFTGEGKTVIQAGGEAYAYQSPDAENPVPTIGSDGAVLNLATGTFAFGTTGYELDGDATVTQMFGITSGINLTVKAGKTLTIDVDDPIEGGNYPGLWVMDSGTVIKGEAGAVIEVKKPAGENTFGKIVFVMNGETSPTANFYDASGAELTTDGSNHIAVDYGVYHWTANAGGEETGGWLKEATWTAEADGTEDTVTSKKITLTFSRAISGLETTDITISGDGEAEITSVSKVDETNNWTVGLTNVTAEETVTVSIIKTGIEPTTSVVTLHKDTTPPAEVTGLTATPGNGKVTLSWTAPEDKDFAKVEITYTTDTEKTTTINAGTATATIESLTNKTAYTFKVQTVDNDGNYSAGTTTGAVTPLAPTAGVGVSWTPPDLPKDLTIKLTVSDGPLYWKAATELTVTAAVEGEGLTYRWELDGEPIDGTGSTLTGTAREIGGKGLSIKEHTITVFVTSGGVEYDESTTFTVAEKATQE